MTRKFTLLLMVLMLALAACGENGDVGAEDDAPEDPDAVDDDDAAADGPEDEAEADGDDAVADDDTACTLEEPVRVGVVFSQTGGAAVYGVSQLAAAELAAEHVNDETDITMELVVEDDASDPSQGITAYERLIESEEVSALIGPTLSNVFFSAGPVADDAGIPAMGVSTTADGISEIGDYVFRDSLTEAQVIPTTVEEATESLGLERVALMYSDDDAFTVSGYEVFADAAEEQGLEITTTQTFATGDTDFSAQLTAARDDDPDALFVSGLAEEASLLVPQARDLGLDVPIVGGNGFNSPAVIEHAGDDAEGVIVGAAWNAAADDEANEEFKAAYEEATGRQPDQFAAQSYAGVKLMAEAITANCSGEPDDIRDGLAGIQGSDTILGEFSFTEGGDADHVGVTQIVEDGTFALLQ